MSSRSDNNQIKEYYDQEVTILEIMKVNIYLQENTNDDAKKHSQIFENVFFDLVTCIVYTILQSIIVSAFVLDESEHL